MDFKDWEPLYSDILLDMGFSREEDERAAQLLSSLLTVHGTVDISMLDKAIRGKDVLVCGNAPGLRDELRGICDLADLVIVAADGAAAIVLDEGMLPHVIVTDLDGDVEKEIIASKRGSIMVVHAHGNNIDKIQRYVPQIPSIIGSTQSVPLTNVHNFGGFSDGDRCVFLAKEFGAASIRLVGFDFYDEDVDPIKKKKLHWAKLLIGLIHDASQV